MARTSASTISRGSSAPRSRSWPRSARGRAGSRSGPAVIDMRYENPFYMAEDAGAADVIAGGRLQLGISRGSPEQVIDGFRHFGYVPARGRDRCRHGPPPRRGLPRAAEGRGLRRAEPEADVSRTRRACCASSRTRPGLRERIWWGAASTATAVWAAELGHEPHELDARVRRERRAAPRPAAQADRRVSRGLESRPATRVSRASRSAAASSPSSTTAIARTSAAASRSTTRSATSTRHTRAIFGRSYAAEPDVLVQRAGGGHSDRGRRHAPAHRSEPARRRLQRARHREHPALRRAGARLALTSAAGGEGLLRSRLNRRAT